MKKIYLFYIVLAIYSCQRNTQRELPVINLCDTSEKIEKLSNYASNISYIPISNSIPIGHISKIIATNNLLFISPVESELLVYDYSGKFIRKIGKIGKGPREYYFSGSFACDEKNKRVLILSGNKIFVYSYEGDQLKEISIGQYGGSFQDIAIIDEHIYLFEFISYGYAKYDWLVLNEDGKIISTKLNYIPKFNSNQGGSGSVVNYKDEILYWNEFNDTIFKIKGGNHNIGYLWANDKFRIAQNGSMESSSNCHILDMVKSKNRLWLTYFLDNSFYTSYFSNTYNKLYFVNQATKISHGGSGPGIINDIDNGLPFIPKYYLQKEKDAFLISWAYAYEFKSKIRFNKPNMIDISNNMHKNNLEKLVSSLHENDNPVLILAKLKE